MPLITDPAMDQRVFVDHFFPPLSLGFEANPGIKKTVFVQIAFFPIRYLKAYLFDAVSLLKSSNPSQKTSLKHFKIYHNCTNSKLAIL